MNKCTFIHNLDVSSTHVDDGGSYAMVKIASALILIIGKKITGMRPTLGAHTCAPQHVYPGWGAYVRVPRLCGAQACVPPPPETCAPLMMGPQVYKGRIRLRPFTSALTPGLQLFLSGCLLGS
jgi:hypothetical protein